MRYVIEYQRVKFDKNGNGRSVAVLWAPSEGASTARNGEQVVRAVLCDVAVIGGYRDDVWDIVERMQAAGAMVMDRHPQLNAMPRGGRAFMHSSDFHAQKGPLPALLPPEDVETVVRAHVMKKALGRAER